MEVESSDKSAVKNDEDAPDEDDLEESNLFPVSAWWCADFT